MSAYKRYAFIIVIALCMNDLYASEFTSTQGNASTATASSFAHKVTQLKDNLYATFNNLRSSTTNYTEPYRPYGWPLTFAGLGAFNLYNACAAPNRLTQYLIGSIGAPLLGLSFYTAYKSYMAIAKDKQLEEQAKNEKNARIDDLKKSYNELKNYVIYIISSLLTQPDITDSEILNIIKSELKNKKFDFSYDQEHLILCGEFAQLPKEQQLPVDLVIQNIILDTLGPAIALAKNAEGNYVIDPHKPTNKTLNKQAISKKLTAIFSTPHEFSFDKKLIESFSTKQESSPANNGSEQTFELPYIEKED